MRKRIFILLIVLMSLSLIGIISIQAYYINESVKNEKEHFKFNVVTALNYVSNIIEENELETAFKNFQKLDKDKVLDSTNVSQLLVYRKNNTTNETLIYKSNVLEENYKLSSSLFDIGLDSLDITNIIGNSTAEVYTDFGPADKDLKSPIAEIIRNSGSINEAQRISFEKSYKAISKRTPIHKRVSEEEIRNLLAEKLKKDGIDINFELAIYSNDLATKVSSENFENKPNSTFKVPIFYDENRQTPYRLLVNFPNDDKFILSGVIGMILLSVIFTLIIILAYTSAILQLVKQRKISQIKSDFINNMTHEFKTPIATINLALDAIKNPKIISDETKVLRYLKMIKDENKRMHAQVENVLRISKLEKNELNISKERVKLHDLVEDAIMHVELIIEDRKGYIKSFLNADKSSVLANDTHFTNVIVNILDNAIKYSPNAPEIEVYTENVGTNIVLKIKDHGSGMSKAVAKRVFEKFYREHTGNIHNVKGHGLGLAYVKRIVEDHQGHISVESEKDKGSTFIIKLPLIS